MSIKKSRSTSIIDYLEYKQASYIGEIYKKGCPIDKAFIYMEKLCDHHTEKELRFIKANLDGATEAKKFFAPKEVFYTSLSSGVFAFLFALLSIFTSIVIGIIGFIGGAYLDSFEGDSKKEEIKNVVVFFRSLFYELADFGGYVGIGVMVILFTIVFSMSVYLKNFNKIIGYKAIVDQCLEIKISQNKVSKGNDFRD
ncbi:hypothetical protein R3398_17150 [Rossellomorea marisflavi]|uniref:hypothetical protein n=1 Tax=Rossellomorea marisflavi TaxID=189381 RepID=UPI00296F04AD|nr:hypothetical protein [Rossellomorea marisflavi]MDW4528096.1 hypothetical protein [Rossellomorea marisflavi]